MSGPQESRLDAGLAPATTLDVAVGKITWDQGAQSLERVAIKLRQILSTAEEFGVETGPALRRALEASIEYLGKQQDKMTLGGTALQQAQFGLSAALDEHRKLKAPGGEYAPYSPRNYAPPADVDDMSELQKKAHQDDFNRGESSAAAQQEAKREEKARQIAAQLDRDYEEPIATMKSIYGYQEPTSPPSASGGHNGSSSGGGYAPPTGSGGTGYSGPGGSSGGIQVDQPTHPDHPQSPNSPTNPDSSNGNPEGPGTSTEPGAPTSPVPGGSGTPLPPMSTSGPGGGGVSPGLLGGVAGGIAGGAALGAIARGGGLSGLLGKGSLSSRGVAPIGGTSRGSSGVLGRTGAGTAAGGRGAGSAGRGAGAAGRGGAASGGRGGSAAGRGAAGGRGGKAKDQKKASDRDRFDDGEDWLDDDGVGPAVLD